LSIDTKRGLVFLAATYRRRSISMVVNAWQELVQNSLLASDASSGTLIWYYHIHHDIWSYDLPALSNSRDHTKDGKSVDA